MDNKIYDVIIIGSGPAGLAASIYASRFGLSHLILGEMPGGTIIWAHKVDNYPGLPDLSGAELGTKFFEHAKKLGAEFVNKSVTEIKKDGEGLFTIKTDDGLLFITKAVILSMGTKRRELGVPGEKKLAGKGVSYCSTCDAAFYKGKVVAVVGGADSACSGAIHVAQFAKKVYLLYRRNSLRAEPFWTREIKKKENIEILYETNVLEIEGENRVEKIKIDKSFKGLMEIPIEGIFIEVGGMPVSKLAAELGVALDEEGYILTSKEMATNVFGLYCAGDLNSFWKEFQQVTSAVAEGAIAANSVYQYLKKQNTVILV